MKLNNYIYFMHRQNYTNFKDQKTEDEIPVGIPVNFSQGQMPNGGYFQQPLNPHMQAQGMNHNMYGNYPQNYNQPHLAAIPMVNQQVVIPQPQTLDYSKPINIRCPCCSMQVTTLVNLESGNAAYLWAGLIFCLISPCCSCLPFTTDKCMDKNHFCPNCGFNILRKHRGFICP